MKNTVMSEIITREFPDKLVPSFARVMLWDITSIRYLP